MGSRMAAPTDKRLRSSGTIDRRDFLKATAATTILTGRASSARASSAKGFSIALGGGAARGLAHIPVLQVLDELGVVPSMISGTSMGAIIGAVYASGVPASEIRSLALDLLSSRLTTLRRLFPVRSSNWTSILALDNSAALDPEKLMSAILPSSVPATFEGLKIPMRIVTTDFYRKEEFVISSGPLYKAIGASAALPVFLSPVQWDERILIDGGFVNPTPFDILEGQNEAVIAVDVTGEGKATTGEVPGALDTWVGSSHIAFHSLVNERLKRIEPDLLIRPDISAFSTTDFHRVNEILTVADQVRDQVKRQLSELLDHS